MNERAVVAVVKTGRRQFQCYAIESPGQMLYDLTQLERYANKTLIFIADNKAQPPGSKREILQQLTTDIGSLIEENLRNQSPKKWMPLDEIADALIVCGYCVSPPIRTKQSNTAEIHAAYRELANFR